MTLSADMKVRTCVRCGRIDNVQGHHILERSKGGGDEPENKEPRCEACHDYEHTRRAIVASIESWQDKLDRARKLSRRLGIRARLDLLRHRLEVLDSLNTPEQIRLTGKYTSYWTDETTHEVRPIPLEEENQITEVAEQVKLL